MHALEKKSKRLRNPRWLQSMAPQGCTTLRCNWVVAEPDARLWKRLRNPRWLTGCCTSIVCCRMEWNKTPPSPPPPHHRRDRARGMGRRCRSTDTHWQGDWPTLVLELNWRLRRLPSRWAPGRSVGRRDPVTSYPMISREGKEGNCAKSGWKEEESEANSFALEFGQWYTNDMQMICKWMNDVAFHLYACRCPLHVCNVVCKNSMNFTRKIEKNEQFHSKNVVDHP